MHAGGGTNDRGEKRNVLIVGVLLLIGSNLSLRSNTQRRCGVVDAAATAAEATEARRHGR